MYRCIFATELNFFQIRVKVYPKNKENKKGNEVFLNLKVLVSLVAREKGIHL